jgi:hypothetical protein
MMDSNVQSACAATKENALMANNSFPIIDADAHVIETQRTWDYLNSSDHKYRPKLCSAPEDPTRQYWVIDDKIAGFRFLTLSERAS